MAVPYCLKRDSHCNTVLDQLFKDNTFADVTLTAEGKSIRAHKSVLSLASSYFQQVLWKEPNVQNVIVFRDIDFYELENLIRFIYTGEAIVDARDLKSFMTTAQSLEILSLCEPPRTDKGNITSDNEEEFSESGKRLADSTNSQLSKLRKHERTPVHSPNSPAAPNDGNETIQIKSEPTYFVEKSEPSDSRDKSEPLDFTEDSLIKAIKDKSQVLNFDLENPSTSLPRFGIEPSEPLNAIKENKTLQERVPNASDFVCESQWMTIEEAANSCGLSFGRMANASLPSENSSDESQISPSLTYARGRIYPSPAQESLKKLIVRTEVEVNETCAKIDSNVATLEDRIELELKQNALDNYKKLLRSKINAARRSMKSRERRKQIRDGVVKAMATSKAC